MAKAGRPKKEFDKRAFVDLVGLGCDQKDICWYFRDETGKPANVNTLTRWCKRTFKMTFQDFFRENSGVALRIKLRKNQLKLSEKSAAMAIFLGKQYLGQTDKVEQTISVISDETREQVSRLLDGLDTGNGSPDSEGNTV